MTLLEPTGFAEIELVVRKSRFIARGVPAATVEEAQAALTGVKAAHPDASHVVHAYLVGAPGREIGSLTDAGEPRGTAGRPIMDILRGSPVRNVVIAVVRYFGGTKLGTGGLVRAYGGAAREVLQKLRTRPLVLRDHLTIVTTYTYHDSLRRLLEASGAVIVLEDFTAAVTIEVEVPRHDRDDLEVSIQNLTGGTARIDYC